MSDDFIREIEQNLARSREVQTPRILIFADDGQFDVVTEADINKVTLATGFASIPVGNQYMFFSEESFSVIVNWRFLALDENQPTDVIARFDQFSLRFRDISKDLKSKEVEPRKGGFVMLSGHGASAVDAVPAALALPRKLRMLGRAITLPERDEKWSDMLGRIRDAVPWYPA